MKKNMQFLLFFIVLLNGGLNAAAEEKPDVRFKENGTFKIAQFTDIHFKPGVPESEPSIDLIKFILENEKPDLIVFTGDIVTGKPATEGWAAVLSPVIAAGIPFAATLGNHDDEHDLSRNAIYELLAEYPGNLIHRATAASEDGDYQIKVEAEKPGKAALLYFLDSNAYSTLDSVDGYGWITHEQVAWYCKQSKENALGEGNKFPALSFFHIPLPEYRQAFNGEAKRVGQRNEDECSPVINTGMFAAMLLEGNMMGTFVGHDHVNDYIVNYYGIGLAYGRWSGGKTSYGDLQHGSRIIVLEEGKQQFTTWHRLRDGQMEDRVVFPDDLE